MNRGALVLTGLLLVGIGLESCSRVPITGRRQMNLIGESTLMMMADEQYRGFLQEKPPLPASDPRAREVREIGDRIAVAATRYLKEKNMSKRVANFEWEFNTVEDPLVNAWCMPGGKVVFYTGILPVCKDATGIAVVMGHEIAHAIARHGNERMSQAIAIQAGGASLDLLTQENPGLARDILLQSAGVGGQLGMLAYSRQHETEADKMGLIFMAMAGYDPREAPRFWERMSAGAGQKPPELLSTHPSDERRMQDLEAFMPEALKYYKP